MLCNDCSYWLRCCSVMQPASKGSVSLSARSEVLLIITGVSDAVKAPWLGDVVAKPCISPTQRGS